MKISHMRDNFKRLLKESLYTKGDNMSEIKHYRHPQNDMPADLQAELDRAVIFEQNNDRTVYDSTMKVKELFYVARNLEHDERVNLIKALTLESIFCSFGEDLFEYVIYSTMRKCDIENVILDHIQPRMFERQHEVCLSESDLIQKAEEIQTEKDEIEDLKARLSKYEEVA